MSELQKSYFMDHIIDIIREYEEHWDKDILKGEIEQLLNEALE